MRRALLLYVLTTFIVPFGFAESGEVTTPLPPDRGSTGTAPANIHTVRYVGDLMIVFRPAYKVPFGGPVDAIKLRQLSNLAGVDLKYDRDHNDGLHTFLLPKKLTEPEAESLCKKILGDPDVKECGPDYMVFGQGSVSTNDPYFQNGSQWNLGNSDAGGINAVTAWSISTGSPNVVVGILDSGLVMQGASAPYTYHLDLSAGRILPGYDFITNAVLANDGNGRDSLPADPGDYISTAGCPASMTRSSWHGTAVTGVFGATANNNIGIAGVDWSAKILPVRILGLCKSGSVPDLIDAMNWAAGTATIAGVPDNPKANRAKILNISVGIAAACTTVPNLQTTINNLRKRNVVIVVAAGNDDGAPVSLVSPASCDGVITVGSITRFGGTGTSTIGSRIDVSAPGAAKTSAPVDDLVVTTDGGTLGPVYNSAYAYAWGTSFAAPQVTGVASLIRAASPTMTGQQVRKLIRQSAAPFPINTDSDCTTAICGTGILDAGKAVALAKSRTKAGIYHDVSLGSGAVGATATAPLQLAGLSGVADVSAGTYHSVAAKADGTVWAWGYNGTGELGNGTVVDQSAPVQATGLTGVIAVAAGDAHTLALKSDGTVWAWGYNFAGQLGVGSFDFTDRAVPTQVINLANVVAIAAGGAGSMALTDDGTVWVWGSYKGDLFSALYGTTTLPPVWTTSGGQSGPYQVPPTNLSNVVSIAAGGSYGVNDVRLALTGDGALYAWGNNEFGELGQGTTTASGLPLLVSALSARTITSAATSGKHVVAVADDGTQWAWGNGFYGQLADGKSGPEVGHTYDHYSATPIQVATGLTNVTDMAVGTQHTIAMKADMTIAGWGYNAGGQLGNGTTADSTATAQVLGSDHTGAFNILNTSSAMTDVQITITNLPNPVQAGQNLTYTIAVANVGLSPAVNIVANLALPASATFVSASPGCVFSINAASVACTVGTLAGASNVNLQVVAKLAASAGIYSAVANVRSDTTDTNSANNVAGATVTVTVPAVASTGDVPTLPEWAAILLGLALMGVMVRSARFVKPPQAG
jgi:uncharacterized repeat protein (TIGR01451 family)